jgi:hypothetical protein
MSKSLKLGSYSVAVLFVQYIYPLLFLRGALLSSLLQVNIYVTQNLLNVLVQILNKMGLKKKLFSISVGFPVSYLLSVPVLFLKILYIYCNLNSF